MATDLTGVGGALQAVSQPVVKLLDMAQAACGVAFEPTRIRRKAKAEAEALIIQDDVNSLLLERAQARLEAKEVRRQKNIEAVVGVAAEELPAEVSKENVSPDWATRFFDKCQDVSDEKMRQLWGRLLAGEVAAPGSYSLRTLEAVALLSEREARNFARLCSGSMRLVQFLQVDLLLFDVNKAAFEDMGLGPDFELFGLVEAGLVTYESMGWTRAYKPGGAATFMHPTGQYIYEVQSPLDEVSNSQLLTLGTKYAAPVGHVNLTAVGRELSRLIPLEPNAKREVHLLQGWLKERCKIWRRDVVNAPAGADVELGERTPITEVEVANLGSRACSIG